MDIIETLQSFDCFTTSEKSIIEVIFQNPEILQNGTAQELAKAAYTSASTVVRLCQKLGCKNYAEFRVRFLSDLQKRYHGNVFVNASLPFQSTNSLQEISHQLLELQTVALNETEALLDFDRLSHAVDMLAGADCIDIYGMGMNLHLAYDFLYKMRRIGRKVQISMDYQEQMLTAATKYKNHCAIIISYTGESTISLRCAAMLKRMETPIVAITSAGDNSVARYADERLLIATLEKQFSKIGPFVSSTSITAIMNCLYAGIFAKDYDENYQELLSTVLRVTEFRSKSVTLHEDQ